MKQWKISTRLYLVAALAAACMTGLAAASWMALQRLAQLQDTAFQRSVDAGEVKLAAGLGDSLYRVVADTYINREFDEVARKWQALTSDGGQKMAHAAKLANTAKDRQAIASAQQAFKEILATYNVEFLPLVQREGSTEEVRAIDARMDRLIDSFDANMSEVAKRLEDVATSADRDYDETAGTTRLVLAAAVVLGGVMLVLVAIVVARSITSQLGMEPAAAIALATSIAEGDLTHAPPSGSSQEQSLATALAAMVQKLQVIVARVRTGADSVATASVQIAQGNGDLSGRTEEQASALQETAATMEQLGSAVTQTAQRALEARGLTQVASQAATRGEAVVTQVVQTMLGIAESSRRIADINAVIDGIAFQTNILALNAAVEAARAGEQGRGFAVVAAEVRTLAQRSAEAAREIKSLIGESVERVEAGTALVAGAGDAMAAIEQAIHRVNAIVEDITGASQEQSHGVAQVGQAVQQMDSATQQNAALVEESAAAADSLRQQAASLVEVVATFRLDAKNA
jgi:methyl-accepting chemotaxis protein